MRYQKSHWPCSGSGMRSMEAMDWKFLPRISVTPRQLDFITWLFALTSSLPCPPFNCSGTLTPELHGHLKQVKHPGSSFPSSYSNSFNLHSSYSYNLNSAEVAEDPELIFEYLESDQPQLRRPLYDQ